MSIFTNHNINVLSIANEVTYLYLIRCVCVCDIFFELKLLVVNLYVCETSVSFILVIQSIRC